MSDTPIGVKPTGTPPPAAVASPATQTPPAPAPATGGKVPEHVPYNRFKEVLSEREQLAEQVEILQRKLVQNPQPVPAKPKDGLPDPDADPLGHMMSRMARIEQTLDTQESRARLSEGEKLLSQIKTDYPVFNDPDIGSDALLVLQTRLSSDEGNVRAPARIVREVAEKYSRYVVAKNNSLPNTLASVAAHTAALGEGSPEVGGIKTPFKPKNFDEANRAAKGAWDRIAQSVQKGLQV